MTDRPQTPVSPDQSRPPRAPKPGEPVLPAVELNLHSPIDAGIGTVFSTHRCTASTKAAGFVRHVAIDVSSTRLAGRFRPGQSFGVLPPGVDEKGRPHALRLYSIASPSRGEDGQSKVLSTTVKRLIDEHHEDHSLFLGVASNYLCSLKPGDQVRITGPAGKRFLIPAAPDEHEYLFIATGTGIAPFRGMILDMLEGGPGLRSGAPITLIMGSPYATDLLYHKELQDLAAHHPNFRYLTALSRERQADGGAPMYVQDRLAHDRERLTPGLVAGKTLIYVCGIAGMELGVFQTLARLLPEGALDGYLAVDAEHRGKVDGWDRKMVHRQLKPSRRVFLEVY
ncbi:MAG: hypothetical protein IT436_11760 [Phycisphaerales bacterium]|nr:hypothetical protein [Phycisphaerales bacterium]